MRIAISGTHFSGKSSLVEALSETLPHYTTIDEPYHQLQDEGYEFAEVLSLEDFELQLERAIEDLNESPQNVIFDRCPIDILGYLLADADVEAFDLKTWLPRVLSAVRKLDLVVLLSIEEPERIVLPVSQDAVYRQRVDEILREIILEDPYGLDVDVLEAGGSVQMRAKQVLAYLSNKDP